MVQKGGDWGKLFQKRDVPRVANSRIFYVVRATFLPVFCSSVDL